MSKPTERDARDAVRKSMSEADAPCYVPVQKFTIAIAMLATTRCCMECSGNCNGCEIPVMYEKLKTSIGYPPIFDADFNVLTPPVPNESEASDDD